MNKNILFIILLVTILVISGCAKVVEEKEPIKLTMHLWPGYVHSYIAQEKGFFEEEGVEVELIINEDIQENINFFLNRRADLAFGLQSDAMKLAGNGFDLKIVYVVDYSDGGDVIVSKTNIKSIEDLKGKTISVDSLNSFNHIFVLELLRLNGMIEDDVEIVPILASDVPEALESGQIDAGQTWEPYQGQAIGKGFRLLASTADAPGIVTDVLMARTDIVEERPDEVRAIVKALFRALEFRETNQAEAYAIMSEAFNIPAGNLKGTIEGNIFPDLEGNKRSFTKSDDSESLYKSGQIISDFFVRKGIFKDPVNLDELLAAEIVNGIE